jgi:anhydro-N-acetylmuramic acid kinase
MSTRAMTVAGMMSGTSADGIDVAIVRIAPGKVRPKFTLLAHEGFAYPAELRKKVLAAMNANSISTPELARLNWRLGIAYAEAVTETARRQKVKIDLVGCHGQTLYHQPSATKYAGRSFACTWQAGEAQAIAAALEVPVVSNFRPADMFAGGQGAPLVPLLDYVLFADLKRGRILQNIGGIANLTAIPPGARPEQVIAFDSGPGNMIIDWLAQKLFDKPYDPNGAIAARGRVLDPVLNEALRNPFFRLKPPKSAGREQFGREYAAQFLAACRRQSKIREDALATATALTAETIARSYARFVWPAMAPSGAKARSDAKRQMYGLKPAPFKATMEAQSARNGKVDFIVSGGGVRNPTLMAMLAARLEPLGCTMRTSEDFGMPAAAKEAAAFALLAWQTWHRLPGNVPSATGAKRPVILGQISYA